MSLLFTSLACFLVLFSIYIFMQTMKDLFHFIYTPLDIAFIPFHTKTADNFTRFLEHKTSSFNAPVYSSNRTNVADDILQPFIYNQEKLV